MSSLNQILMTIILYINDMPKCKEYKRTPRVSDEFKPLYPEKRGIICQKISDATFLDFR